MSDGIAEPEAAIPPSLPAPFPTDAFRDLANLLRCVVDERAVRTRLKELRAAQGAAERGKAELEAARAAHDALIVRERSELEAEREALQKGKVALRAAEGMLAAGEEVLASRQANLDLRSKRYEPLPGGGVREFAAGYTGDEASPADEVRDEPEDEFVPIRGTTITRDEGAPRRRSMRRIQDI
jgi:hypothetical protein